MLKAKQGKGNITRTVYGFSIVDWYYAGTLVV